MLAEDDIIDRPRRYVTRLGSKWQKEGDALPKGYRIRLAGFISCAWCLGFWVAAGWWVAWQIWPNGTLIAASLAAISAVAALIADH